LVDFVLNEVFLMKSDGILLPRVVCGG